MVHEPAIEQRGGAVFIIGLVYLLRGLWDIRQDEEFELSVEDCPINIRKGLDFVALCGLGNTLVLSRIDPAVAGDPQVLHEAAAAMSENNPLEVGAPTKKVHAGVGTGGEGKGASPAFSLRNCHVLQGIVRFRVLVRASQLQMRVAY